MAAGRLIIADSEKNANLYYATRFLAPDPFIFLEANGNREVIMSDLELDRARAQAKVGGVVAYSRLAEQAKQGGVETPTMMDVVDVALRARGVTHVDVPADFGLTYADALRQRGYTVEPKPDPFCPERVVKTEEEVGYLTQTLRVTEEALACVIELIRNSEARADGVLWLGGKPLTAELLRRAMHLVMMERDCVAQHTIVACGRQGVDPHQQGTGPLRANEPIVMDVFPQHAKTRYFADITRTVVKGRASEKVRRMFEAVKEGQGIAFRMIKDGVDGAAVHRAIRKRFDELGFQTGEQDGRMQGFFHGTGHGVGLEIHEPPRVGVQSDILKAGMVVTVEPGLYYLDAGGMRIEDMVVVTREGCRVLTEAPKVLEV